MPRRDPETGQFVSGGGRPYSDYEDIEVISGNRTVKISAANADGSTDEDWGQSTFFEGVDLYDLDEILDRHTEATMLRGEHRWQAIVKSTSTADGTVRAAAEVSTSPVVKAAANDNSAGDDAEGTTVTVATNSADASDSMDLIGRPLTVYGTSAFSDGSSGVGGGGSAGEDHWVGVAANPMFDGRDNVFLNGMLEVQNVADAAVHAELAFQHVYGIETR